MRSSTECIEERRKSNFACLSLLQEHSEPIKRMASRTIKMAQWVNAAFTFSHNINITINLQTNHYRDLPKIKLI